jgi:Flp pilus assembly protein TadG
MSWRACRNRLAALRRDNRGVAAVEFAVVGMMAISLMLTAIEVARYNIVAQSLRHLAAEAARNALVSVNRSLGTGDCQPATVNQASLLQQVPVLRAGRLELQVESTCPEPNSTGLVTVRATYDFTFVVGWLPSARVIETARLVI